ncbi:MAG: 30S ribosome-binding factor RbfA [Planctomycetota bacterium]|nr:MAG: 30S ribosome-binding factor RbfA [Planctomycetota bacterium]
MSHRNEQIASTIQRAVQAVISRGLNDPRVRGLVSVTKVLVDDDLSKATIYISVLPSERGALTMHGLRAAAKRIRRDVGNVIRLRHTPRLIFRLDDSIKRQSELEQTLKE